MELGFDRRAVHARRELHVIDTIPVLGHRRIVGATVDWDWRHWKPDCDSLRRGRVRFVVVMDGDFLAAQIEVFTSDRDVGGLLEDKASAGKLSNDAIGK